MESQEIFEIDQKPTIKGFPELRWTGKTQSRVMPDYPAQPKEQYGEPKAFGPDGKDWINKIYWGDNLQVMSHLRKEYRGSIDLIYIDPPFQSGQDFTKTIKLRGEKVSSDGSSFEEKQYKDIWSNDEYLQFMYERIVMLRELLNQTGAFYVHCDHRKVSHLRLICDEIFGPDNFLNQITWRRQIPRGRKVDSKYYAFSADFLLIYCKCKDKAKWHSQNYSKYISIEDAEKKYYKDERGFFRTSDPGSYSFENLCEFHKEGRLYAPHNGQVIIDYENRRVYASKRGQVSIKYYRKQKGDKVEEDVYVDNIWDDIPGMGVVSSESLGYPTQKPEKLLERVILASSDPGDLVFDCFMGSGTAQTVAMKHGRRFIGADINLDAVQTTTKRLLATAQKLEGQEDKYTGFEVYNVNDYDFFRNPEEARDLLIKALNIQPFPKGNTWDGELDGRMVKIMPVSRIASKADLKGLLSNLPYREYEKRKAENPSSVVEQITIVCMGHEPDLKGWLEKELSDYKVDIEIRDILRDRKDLELKREAEARIEVEDGKLVVKEFYPRNLMQKLSIIGEESVDDWRELVDSIRIDWNYDGGVMQPSTIDIPKKNDTVKGIYDIPEDRGTIKVKITDLLSESLELEIK